MILSLSILAVWPAAAIAQKVVGPCPCYTLQVGLGTQAVKLGDRISIEVTISITVDHEIFIEQNTRDPGAVYFVDVRDTSGVRQDMTASYSQTTGLLHAKEAGLPETSGLFRGEDGKVYLRTYRFSNEPVRIVKPGGKAKATILLNDLYRLDKVGTYTIQLKQRVGKEEIDSNIVSVAITN
jgi:hypothetical protein